MHWYDWHTVTERLQARSYAITRGRPYKVVLDPAAPTGICDFTNQKIVINPNLFDDVFRRRGLSGSELDKANFLVSRAITGHEALHVLHSDPADSKASSRSQTLKIVFNLLEDARIEKIGAETSHVAKTLFSFVNHIAAGELTSLGTDRPDSSSEWLDVLLRWRLSAPIPPLENTAAAKWKRARSLAEDALYASDSKKALAIARRIVKLLGMDKEKDDGQNMPEALGPTQSEMTGSRSGDPVPNPLRPRDEDETDAEGGSESTEPSEATGREDGDGSKQQDGLQDGPSPSDDESDSPTDSQYGTSGEGEEQEHSTGADDNDATQQALSGGGQGDGTNQDGEAEDLSKLVESVAAVASEDLGSLIPEDSSGGTMVAKSKSESGHMYSDIAASPYIPYLSRAIPIADDIVRELKTENPKAVSGASGLGKFRSRYFLRDRDKPFSSQCFRGIGTPKMALTLVLDRSASMEDIVEELRIMSMAVVMACEKLSVPLSIWALEGQVQIKKFNENGPQVLAKLAGLRAETFTRMMPTIRDAHEELSRRPEEVKHIVLIHDGLPGDPADFIDWRTGLRGIGLFCLRIMSELDFEVYRQYPQNLREKMVNLVGPQQHAIAPITDIAKHWCAFVRNKRRPHQ